MIGSVMLAVSATNLVPVAVCFEGAAIISRSSIHLARPQTTAWLLLRDQPVERLPDTVYIETSQLELTSRRSAARRLARLGAPKRRAFRPS